MVCSEDGDGVAIFGQVDRGVLLARGRVMGAQTLDKQTEVHV